MESARFNANGISLSKPLTANSGLTLFGNLSTNGVVTLGTTTINGNLSASGSAAVGSLTSLGPVTISGTLSSSGLATLGTATIKGNLSAQGSITSADLTLNSTAAQEGGQINFNRSSDNTTSFVLDVYSNAANNNDNRFRVINGVELMTVLSSGNVGIGTSAPGYKLEVYGGSFFNNLTSNSSVSFINGNTRIAKNVVDNGLEFFTFNASRMFISDTTGNVGIGTVTPGSKLTINGDISGVSATFTSNVSAPALSGTHYGDGSNLTGLYKPSTLIGSFVTAVSAPALSGNIGTFNTSVSAPALSGTFYGDGSKLLNVVGTDSTKLPLAGGTLIGALNGTIGSFTTSVSAPSLSGTFYGDANLKVVTETLNNLTAAASLSIDLSVATFFKLSLTTNITSLTFINSPVSSKVYSFILQTIGDGTVRSVAWPASIKWPYNVAPTITSTLNKADMFSFLTYDGGTTWYGSIVTQNQ